VDAGDCPVDISSARAFQLQCNCVSAELRRDKTIGVESLAHAVRIAGNCGYGAGRLQRERRPAGRHPARGRSRGNFGTFRPRADGTVHSRRRSTPGGAARCGPGCGSPATRRVNLHGKWHVLGELFGRFWRLIWPSCRPHAPYSNSCSQTVPFSVQRTGQINRQFTRVGPLAPRPAPRAHLTRHPHRGPGDRPRRGGGRGVAASVPKPPPPTHRHRRCAAAAADRPPRISGDRPWAAVPALGVPSGARQHHRPGAVHRVDPQTADEPQLPPPPAPPVVPPPTPYTVVDWEQAVARRRADQAHLRGVDRTLDETDRKAADLNRRILALLADP